MKRELLEQALNEVDTKYIAEAAKPRRRTAFRWVGAVAAVLTVAILGGMLLLPGGSSGVQGTLVAAASPSRQTARPDMDDYADRDAYREAAAKWLAENEARGIAVEDALKQLAPFFTESAAQFLSGDGSNRVYCPLNTYLALAMLAEVTDGSSREQILSVLNTADTGALRAQVHAVWESAYFSSQGGRELCVPANSLWLDTELEYRQDVLESLAYHYYASVYRQDLSDSQAQKALRSWIDENTGNRLKNYSGKLELPEDTALVLASTVNFRSKWAQYTEFSARNNTTATFHAPGGDTTCTFMNKKEMQTNYYWGKSYGAMAMSTANGCRMWFILPDSDKTVSDVLTEGEYMAMILSGTENEKYMKVNFSVPKFDIGSSADLAGGLQAMGITHVFSEDTADFSPVLTHPEGAYLSSVQQATRVAIDEDGVTAASYIVLPAAGAGMPPEEIIDFVLDRPFLFVISDNTGIPLFAGVVSNP